MIIRIKNLRAKTVLGVYPEEQDILRPVLINVSVEYDHSQAIKTDHLRDTIDYGLIERHIVESLAQQKFALLETLAEHVAQLAMGFAGAREVTVEIDKPGALKHADSVSVVHTLAR